MSKKTKRFVTSMRFQQPKQKQNQSRQFLAFNNAQITCVASLIFFTQMTELPKKITITEMFLGHQIPVRMPFWRRKCRKITERH